MKEKLTGERGGMGAQTICLLLGHFSVLEPEFGLFYYPFQSCATVVARKRSSSFGQKCRWQVKAKHTHTHPTCGSEHCKMVHGFMVYTERAQRWHQFHVASAIQPNSAVSTTLRWIIQTRFAKTVTQGRMRLERIESARKQRLALYKSDLSIGKRKNTFKFSTSEEMCFKSLRRVLIMKT